MRIHSNNYALIIMWKINHDKNQFQTIIHWSVVAERSSLPDSSSGVSNVGSNPGRDTCVLEQDN